MTINAEAVKLLQRSLWGEDAPENLSPVEDTSITPVLARDKGYTSAYAADGSSPDRRRINQIVRENQAARKVKKAGIPQYNAAVNYDVGDIVATSTVVWRAVRANGPASDVQAPTDAEQISWATMSGSITVPDVPTDFVFDNSEHRTIDVRWLPGRDNGSAILYYEIQYRQGSSGAWVPATPLRTKHPIFEIDGLIAGSTYNIRVRAVNEVGASDWVATNADTQDGSPIPDPPNEAVGQTPSGGLAIGLRATPGDSQVRLNWRKPDDGGYPIIGYEVQWREDIGSFRLSNTRTGIIDRNFTVTGLTNDTEYDFIVAAHNRLGRGAFSPIVSATPVGPNLPRVQPILLVPSLTPFPIGSFTATARWNAVEDAITMPILEYQWEVDRATGNWSSPVTQAGRVWKATGHFSSGNRIKGRFKARTALGWTDWSPIAYTTIGGQYPEPPSSVSLSIAFTPPSTYRAVISVGPSANDNGSPITDYSCRVVFDEGGIIRTSSTGSFTDTSSQWLANRGTFCTVYGACRNRFGWSYWKQGITTDIPF